MSVTASDKKVRNLRRGQGFNRRKYAELLAETLPAAITNDEELERMTSVVDRLAVKKRLSPEENRLLEMMATLIEVYENTHHQLPEAPPHVMIQGLMEERGLRNKDLEPHSDRAASPRRSSVENANRASRRSRDWRNFSRFRPIISPHR